MKRVWLYVGANQRLVGEAKALAKPVAVLRRRDGEGEAAGEALEVVEVVRYKLLFTGRPEPVGERTESGTGS
jgi:chromosome transmission fidelity protein 8